MQNYTPIYYEHPVILIDKSGSTEMKFNDINVLKKEQMVIQDILKNNKITVCDIIYWSNKVDLELKDVNVDHITETVITPTGGTYLNKPLETIINAKYRDIYIVTDGEICDDQKIFSDIFTKLVSKYKPNIYIITVEGNNIDYNNTSCSAGSTLYKYINKLNYCHVIRSFTSYNLLCNNFYSIDNPIIGDNYGYFRGKMFEISKIKDFINYITDIKDTVNNKNFNKFAYDLCFALKNVFINKTEDIQDDIIKIFCELFSNISSPIETFNLMKHFLNSFKNKVLNSYFDYISNRNKLFDYANNTLKNSVRKAIFTNNNMYFTFPVKGKETYIFYSNKFESSNFNGEEYKESSVLVNNNYIPILPIITIDQLNDNEFRNQCIRQWIRAVYSFKYNLNPSDDRILYLFLANYVEIYFSNASSEIKESFRTLCFILLDRNRKNSGGVKEIKHLKDGNKPSPISSNCNIEDIFNWCLYTLDWYNITCWDLWYLIINSLEDEELINKQKEYFGSKFNVNDFDYIIQVENALKIKNNVIEYNNYNKLQDYSYYCYLTMKSTENSGGFIINSHNINENLVCNPKYVFSSESLKYDELKCPICLSCVNKDMIEYVKNKKYYNKNIKINDIISDFSYDNYSKVDLEKLYLIKSNNLQDLDSIKFNNPFDITNNSNIFYGKNRQVVINNTWEKYNNYITKNYPFINQLKLNNVCIAGGFNRSILLEQPINDIDLFFYGLTKEEIIKKVEEISKIIYKVLYEKNNRYIFIKLYKKNTNVFEILCLEPILLDKINGIDLDYIRKNPNNFKTVYKFQCILKCYSSIEDILNSFDLDSSCVAYDICNNKVVFNTRGVIAYKYMVNIVRESNCSEQYTSRLIKYNNYGFSISMPKLDCNKFTDYLELTKMSMILQKLKDNKYNIVKMYINKSNTPRKVTNKGLYSTGLYSTGLYSESCLKNLASLFSYIDKMNKSTETILIYCDNITKDNDIINDFNLMVENVGSNNHINVDWYGDKINASYKDSDDNRILNIYNFSKCMDIPRETYYTIDDKNIKKLYIDQNNLELYLEKIFDYQNIKYVDYNEDMENYIKGNCDNGLIYTKLNDSILVFNKNETKENIKGWLYDSIQTEIKVDKLCTLIKKIE